MASARRAARRSTLCDDGDDEQREADDAERPEAGRADELAGPDDEPEHDRRSDAVAAIAEHPRAEDDGERREKGDERLRMEHGGRLEHDRARDEERNSREAQPGPAAGRRSST